MRFHHANGSVFRTFSSHKVLRLWGDLRNVSVEKLRGCESATSLRCPLLRSLALTGCKNVTAAAILSLASRCRQLTALDLTRLPLLDDLSLGTLVQARGLLADGT